MKTKNNKQNNIDLTFGADPEIFIFDNSQNKIVSAIDVFQRDKYNPINLGDEVTTYYDNAMGEFTVKPAFSKQEFVDNIGSALSKINSFLMDISGDLSLKVQASHTFENNQLDHPEAKMVGCNPEYNADEIMPIIPLDFSGNLRSAGGHVAIGRKDYKKANESDPLMSFDSRINLVKLLDYYLGVPFTLLDNDPTSLTRRNIYGNPSSHRPKEFGIEYRVLSNFWISSPNLVEMVYDLASVAVEKIINNEYQEIFDKIEKKMVNSCIKEGNRSLADEIVSALKLPANINVRINQLKNVDSWNVYKEWDLNSQVTKNKKIHAR